MSLMSGLYVGTSGLQTGQNALNTTAHNLSNIETSGYTRQQVYLQDQIYANTGMASVSKMQTGLGVEYGQVRQVRDFFLDKAYRKESGRSAFYDVWYESTSEIETLLGEFDGVAFQDTLSKLWTSVQELQKDPASAVTEGAFVNTSAQFVERAQAVYNGLSNFQDNLNSRIVKYIDRINELGDSIVALNEAIMKEEFGEQKANDLRDLRNSALDELSTLVNMSYFSNADGGIEVMVEGTLFVARDRAFHMEAQMDEGTGFYTPIWPHNEKTPVFDMAQEISTDFDTDIGQLKAILLARGDRRANYTDVANKNSDGDYIYNEGFETAAGRKYMATSSSIVMSLQAELDNMVHDMVVKVNDILTKETNLKPDERKYSSAEDCPLELFVRLGTERYKKNGTDFEYVTEDTSKSPVNVDTMYTISNLKINAELLKTPTLMANGFRTDDKKVAQDIADAIADAFSDKFGTLNPNLSQKYNYEDFYAAMVGQVATTGSIYHSMVAAQDVAVKQLDDGRQAVAGVSSNEELQNMIKYQNAYNAASRYITTCNDMLGHLLEKLG